MIPIGMSRFGLIDSSAAVDTASKPMYAKKTKKAPKSVPPHPNGKYGVQLPWFT